MKNSYFGSCELCGEAAYRLKFENGLLTLQSFLGEAFEVMPESTREALQQCLVAGDLVAAYRLKAGYFPGFCPQCGCNYCGQHWQLWPLLDEGWFEGYNACCPKGHHKVIDD